MCGHVAIQGETPLHLALAKKHLEMSKLLLDAGADINARDNKVCLMCAGHAPMLSCNVTTACPFTVLKVTMHVRDSKVCSMCAGHTSMSLRKVTTACPFDVLKMIMHSVLTVHTTKPAAHFASNYDDMCCRA
jgi:hypothetical protein